MSRRTKIVATVGPASQSAEMIELLINAGVNVFRLNFSHGDEQQHRTNTVTIRSIAEKLNSSIAILGDLQGPKIRIGDLANEPIELEQDTPITLTVDPAQDPARDNAQQSDTIFVQYPPLAESVQAGDTLLIDDGLIRLIVISVSGTEVHCQVSQGGLLKSRKGLNRLGGGLSAAAITEKDMHDITLASELKLDYLAVSFPSCAEDLNPVKDKLAELNTHIPIIAKIERAEAVATTEVLEALIIAADGVMVARGDLGVEIGDAQLIGQQKSIIRLARRNNRPVITATQMMESMISSPVPTRAEVFDVANAVLDGTDAVMLSAETAAGKFPDKVVAAMAETCVGAEQHPDIRRSGYRIDRVFTRVDETIAMSAMYAANHLQNIAALICLTESGQTALLMSRLSSGLPIYAVSRHRDTCNRMSLYRGIIPLHYDICQATEQDPYAEALSVVQQQSTLKAGDWVTVTCGDISGAGGLTNTLKILQLS